MRTTIGHHPPHDQYGFTLVEVLVALVVLSIGLLGVAKLVMGAVHADDSAYMRGQATQLAYELLDEMRANRPGAIASNYAGPAGATDCSAASCTPQVLAALDLFNFQARLLAAIPGATYTVTTATGGFNETIATIVVNWDDSLAQYAFGTPAGGPAAPGTVTLVSIL